MITYTNETKNLTARITEIEENCYEITSGEIVRKTMGLDNARVIAQELIGHTFVDYPVFSDSVGYW